MSKTEDNKVFHSVQEIYDYYKKPEKKPELTGSKYEQIGKRIAERACEEAAREVFGVCH